MIEHLTHYYLLIYFTLYYQINGKSQNKNSIKFS